MSTEQARSTDRAWPHRPVPAYTATWARELTDPRDLGRARGSLREHLRSQGHTEDGTTAGPLDEFAERLLLAADELTSNGIRHGQPPIALTLADTPDGCLLVVTDHDPAQGPTPDPDRDPARGGLGLLIIATYADDHGWWTTPTTKLVWASLPHD